MQGLGTLGYWGLLLRFGVLNLAQGVGFRATVIHSSRSSLSSGADMTVSGVTDIFLSCPPLPKVVYR